MNPAPESASSRLLRRLAGAMPEGVRLAPYRFPLVAGCLRRLLNVSLPGGLREVEIAAGPLRGRRLVLDLQTEKFYWLGTYEPLLVKLFQEHVRPGMVAYDIGGHAGYFALLLGLLVGDAGRVFTFEPEAQNAERIRRMIQANGIARQITLVEAAVADQGGEMDFFSGGPASAQGGVIERRGEGRRVRCIALDEWGGPAPEVVKIDLEGAEALVLRGMQQILRRHRPRLVIELHHPAATRETCEILRECGYRWRPLQDAPTEKENSELLTGHVEAIPG